MRAARTTRCFIDKNADWWRQHEAHWETSTWLPANTRQPLIRSGAFEYIHNRAVSFRPDGFPDRPIQPLWLHKSVFFPLDHKQVQVQPSRLLAVATDNIAIVQPHQYASESDYISRGYMVISHTWYNPVASDLTVPFWDPHIPGCEWKLNGSGPNKINAIIDIARMLGYRYVWMDELCIDQTGVTDKQNEIPRMRLYYEGASIGLIVLEANFIITPHRACGQHGDPSCLLGMTLGDENNDGEESNSTYEMRRHLFMQHGFRDVANESAWLHRTWTLQEAQLLPGSLVLFQDVIVSGSLLGDYQSGMQWYAGGRVEKASSALLLSRPFGGYRYHTNPKFRQASQRPRLPICPRELITETLKRERRLDHDVVYGIAGLVPGAENILVDYTMSVTTLISKLFGVAFKICPRVILWSGASPCEEPGYGWTPGKNFSSLVFIGPSCGTSGCVDEEWIEPACGTIYQPIKFLSANTTLLPTTQYSKLRMAKRAGLILSIKPLIEDGRSEEYLAYARDFVQYNHFSGSKSFQHTLQTRSPTHCDLCEKPGERCSCLSYINFRTDHNPRSVEFIELEYRGDNKVRRHATWDLEFWFKSRSGEGKARSDQLWRWFEEIWDIKTQEVEF
jgi:hypothetical protein